jgi:Predicted pyridoxal phosphate-dependent enzyme apparently involved in regulation of cell wall biogenesis
MANLHAAIGLSQLAKIDLIASTRREACRTYNRELSQIEQVRVPNTDFVDVTPFLYYIRVPEEDRDRLRSFLSDKGVDTGIHWQPGHWFTLLKDCPRGDMTVTDRVGSQILSLPLHSCMEENSLARVIDGIREYFAR